MIVVIALVFFPVMNVLYMKIKCNSVRFQGFTAVTMKNGVFWDVTPCGSCKSHTA
jgi:hypothetical protein